MFQFVRELKKVKNSKDLTRQAQAQLMAEIKLPSLLTALSMQTPWVVILTMWVGSTFFTLAYLRLIQNLVGQLSDIVQLTCYSLSIVVFAVTFVLIGALFATIGRAGLIAGKFPRSPAHPIYALRRVFGAAWSQIFYFKPLYAVFLSIPLLKQFLFRAFGYKGPTDFTIYPDAWIRDLPLLTIEKGTYIANRCTIGSNICLTDGSILVGKCHFGEKSLVGHLAIFGLDDRLGRESELGIAVSLGIRITIGDHVSVAPKASIYHGAVIGNNVKIGACALVGLKAKIADHVELKVAAIIPNGAVISTQSDADRYFSSEIESLKSQKEELTELLRRGLDEFSGPTAK